MSRPARGNDADGPRDKPREYPHSSGDRNTFPLRPHPRKETFVGGRQRVAPTDVDGQTRGGGDDRGDT